MLLGGLRFIGPVPLFGAALGGVAGVGQLGSGYVFGDGWLTRRIKNKLEKEGKYCIFCHSLRAPALNQLILLLAVAVFGDRSTSRLQLASEVFSLQFQSLDRDI